MERLYKVTSSITTLFVADDSFGVDESSCWSNVQNAGENAIAGEQENRNPIVKVEEVKTLEDLPEGWSGNELVWGVDDDGVTAKKWLEEQGQYRAES